MSAEILIEIKHEQMRCYGRETNKTLRYFVFLRIWSNAMASHSSDVNQRSRNRNKKEKQTLTHYTEYSCTSNEKAGKLF